MDSNDSLYVSHDYRVTKAIELQILQDEYIKNHDPKETMICAIEEMSEATKVMTKYIRNSRKFTVAKLEEEVAHAQLMLDTVRKMFNITNDGLLEQKILAFEKAKLYEE